MATQIARDPFARTTLMREAVSPAVGCEWCGGSSRAGRTARLFHYFWEQDSIYTKRGNRVNLDSATKLFCSVSCFRAYTSDA